jgi:phosphate ABC transporter permease protein PstC
MAVTAIQRKEKLIERIFLLIAFSSIFSLFIIALFIFAEGLPLIWKVGLKDFLFSTRWAPTKGHFGIFAMIVSSFWVTIGALLFGGPLGLMCSFFLVEFASERLRAFIKPALELLAGIPSVVYGFLGVVYLVPLVRDYLGGPGLSLLTASIILGIMILPTVISISVDALVAVPDSYREAAFSLGATRWQTTYMVTAHAARSGIITSLVLGMGRAVGETMAVIMIAGNALKIPLSPLDPLRTLTSNIALEMGYASGMHRQALFATGIVLFFFVMALNTIATIYARRKRIE